MKWFECNNPVCTQVHFNGMSVEHPHLMPLVRARSSWEGVWVWAERTASTDTATSIPVQGNPAQSAQSLAEGARSHAELAFPSGSQLVSCVRGRGSATDLNADLTHGAVRGSAIGPVSSCSGLSLSVELVEGRYLPTFFSAERERGLSAMLARWGSPWQAFGGIPAAVGLFPSDEGWSAILRRGRSVAQVSSAGQ